MICLHSFISYSVSSFLMILPVDTSIPIGLKISSDASIFNFLNESVGSLHIFIPTFWHCFGLMSYFPIRLPKHGPCPNSKIKVFPESSYNAMTSIKIGMFNCSDYYGRKGNILQSSQMNCIWEEFVSQK